MEHVNVANSVRQEIMHEEEQRALQLITEEIAERMQPLIREAMGRAGALALVHQRERDRLSGNLDAIKGVRP